MKIYRKLYLWFLLVFVLTIAVVSLMIHTFYTERVRDELHVQLESHAQFLMAEYQEACRVLESDSCSKFIERLRGIRPFGFWIVNNAHQVVLSNQTRGVPELNRSDLEKARKGETVVSFRRRAPAYVIIPLKNSDGVMQGLAIVQRGLIRGRRFPFFASLIIVLITIAILIFPLSKRLTRPLRELHQRGQDWAEGRLEKRANIQVKDEIGDLAGTFNTMAENLQKMLQQRKEFLASISHELKSPLARMRIALELLNEKNSGQPETSKLLGGIEREIAESEQLIEQLLVLSKVEMNMPLSKESIALGILTKKAIEQSQPLADRASVTFRIEGDATVHADYVQLERVMINVLENAIKFSPPGESIAIHIQRHNQYATWKCIDHGPGVDSSETEKIFQPFYRGKVTANKEGSGLGLFIARRIVEMHGGSIHAMKNDGTGMAIEIQLPV